MYGPGLCGVFQLVKYRLGYQKFNIPGNEPKPCVFRSLNKSLVVSVRSLCCVDRTVNRHVQRPMSVKADGVEAVIPDFVENVRP
jgi:hypothetical protein